MKLETEHDSLCRVTNIVTNTWTIKVQNHIFFQREIESKKKKIQVLLIETSLRLTCSSGNTMASKTETM